MDRRETAMKNTPPLSLYSKPPFKQPFVIISIIIIILLSKKYQNFLILSKIFKNRTFRNLIIILNYMIIFSKTTGIYFSKRRWLVLSISHDALLFPWCTASRQRGWAQTLTLWLASQRRALWVILMADLCSYVFPPYPTLRTLPGECWPNFYEFLAVTPFKGST